MPAQIVQIDLAQPLPTVTLFRRYDAVRILVRSGEQPIGWVRCGTSDFGAQITPDRLSDLIAAQLSARLAGAQHSAAISTAPPYTPFVSIVVCTRDRADKLDRLLRSIARLDYPKFETIVVDNAPRTDASRQLCERLPIARYVVEPRRGLNYARNTGWQVARGEIIAYTSDDACVDPNWLHALSQNYADSTVQCVTGAVFPLELATAAQEFLESNSGRTPDFARRVYKPGTWNASFPLDLSECGTGANLSLRRSTLQQLMGFDVALNVGSLTRSAGDLDILARVLRDAGGSIVYEPRAICWQAHPRTDAELRAHAYDTGYGFAAYAMKHTNDLELGNLAVALLRRRVVDNFRKACRARCPQALSFAFLELAGNLLGWRAYRRSVRKVASDQKLFKSKGTAPFIPQSMRAAA